MIEAGNITLLFGPPGSFKGFAVGQLAMNGARGSGQWLGFDVNCQFRTLWINCENGDRRMKNQFARMEGLEAARDYVLTTSIPAVWSLSDSDFVRELRQTIVSGGLRLIVLDTVSNFAGDEMAKDFAAFFGALNAILQGLPHKVAVLLIHHSRKPKDGDKGGRGLLHLISGHQMLQRRARCILYLGRVTEEQNETRVVGACLKCSDNGEAEKVRVPLQLNDKSELAKIPDFDWNEWGAGTASGTTKRESKVSEEHVRTVFENGNIWLTQRDAAAKLMAVADAGRSAAYEALKAHGGRFSDLLTRRDDGMISIGASDL